MSDNQKRECPFISRCWLSGNYNYCKTATCSGPLVPKDEKQWKGDEPQEIEYAPPAPGELF